MLRVSRHAARTRENLPRRERGLGLDTDANPEIIIHINRVGVISYTSRLFTRIVSLLYFKLYNLHRHVYIHTRERITMRRVRVKRDSGDFYSGLNNFLSTSVRAGAALDDYNVTPLSTTSQSSRNLIRAFSNYAGLKMKFYIRGARGQWRQTPF